MLKIRNPKIGQNYLHKGAQKRVKGIIVGENWLKIGEKKVGAQNSRKIVKQNECQEVTWKDQVQHLRI